MRYKHFDNANVEISSLAVGTWGIGGDNFGPVDRSDAVAAIQTMLEQGVNLIDTAPCYGNGAAEKIVGETIHEYDRSKIYLSTKFGLVTDIYNRGYVKNASYKNVMREVQSSLMNLKTDYIDFYFIHWPDVQTPIGETMAALLELKEKGYIRFIGVSNFSSEQIQQAQQYGKIDVQQPPFSMVDQTYTELMKWGKEQGIDAMTYGSMGAGILSGKYRQIPNFEKNDLRLMFYDTFHEPKFSKIMQLLVVLDQIAEAHNRPVAQVALNWSTQKEFVGTALVGVRSKAHALENATAFEWELKPDEMKKIDETIMHLGL